MDPGGKQLTQSEQEELFAWWGIASGVYGEVVVEGAAFFRFMGIVFGVHAVFLHENAPPGAPPSSPQPESRPQQPQQPKQTEPSHEGIHLFPGQAVASAGGGFSQFGAALPEGAWSLAEHEFKFWYFGRFAGDDRVCAPVALATWPSWLRSVPARVVLTLLFVQLLLGWSFVMRRRR
jgi:hypothetical protein